LREVGLVQPDAALNPYVRIVGYVNIRDMLAERAPEDLPEDVAQVFQEGAACLAIGCFNASATMFRLCVDLATRNLLPADNANGLNRNVRQYLGHRLAWLFEHEYLPHRFRRLSTCIKDDGNDGAHQGTIGKEEAEDLLDFTRVLLQHIYTDPARITRAERRTADRRKEQED